jgi:2-polyprenyl-3-methyl-5-hydroxy-6-metoxy-1,4-benzoquinol methylase
MRTLPKRVMFFVREKFHAQRANLLMVLMSPKDGASILDVGGGTGDFLARIRANVRARCVVAEIGAYYGAAVRERGFEFVQLEEGERLPFGDQEFELVVSISVIEHVTVPKEACMSRMPQDEWVSRSLQSQRWFANEIRRVGKAYFVQTPHKSFPLETHTWLPFVNWLDHNQLVSLVRFTDKYWVKPCGRVDWNLLGDKDMQGLFPESTIHVERVFGLPKSVIAYYPSN